MIQLHRQTSFDFILKSPEGTQGFFLYLQVGIEKAIQAESGMSVNLVLVDQWLSELKKKNHGRYWQSYQEAVSSLRDDLSVCARAEQARVCSLSLYDPENLKSKRWTANNGFESVENFYIEYLDKLQVQRLCRFELIYGDLDVEFNEELIDDIQQSLGNYLHTAQSSAIEDLLRKNQKIHSIQIADNQGGLPQLKWQLSARD